MTNEEIFQAVDTNLQTWFQFIVSKQNDYIYLFGRYWQGLPASSVPPIDGADATVDGWDTTGSGGCSWRDLAKIDAPVMKSQVSIDSYKGPVGDGFIINLRISIGSSTYKKAVNVGPETFRNMDWTQEIPLP